MRDFRLQKRVILTRRQALPGKAAMRRALGLAVLVTCVTAASAGAANAATPFDLTATGGKPQVTVDAAGNGHFVWDQGSSSGPDVTHYCRVPPGGTACATSSQFVPPAADPSNNEDFDGPRVFVAGSIVIVMTHRCCGGFPPAGSDGIVIFVSTNGGSTFGSGEVVGNGEMAGDAILGPGARFSTISDVVTGGTFYQAQSRGTFTDVSANLGDSGPSQSYSGSLALIDVGTPIATFDDLDTTFWRRYTGSGSLNDVANWTPTATVGPGDEGRLAYGPSGVWLMYRTGTPGDTTYVARRFTGAGFGSPIRVTETGDPIFADYSQDAGGHLHAVWLEGSRALMYRRSDDGTSYGPITRLMAATFGVFNLEVGAGSDGEGWAVWDSNSDTGPVRAVALEVAQQPPRLGRTVSVDVVEGEVFISLPAGSARASQKGSGFVPLTEARTDPGALDTRHAAGNRPAPLGPQPGRRDPVGPVHGRCLPGAPVAQAEREGPDRAGLKGSTCRLQALRRQQRTATASRLSRRAIRRLRARAKGRYRTRGRHSAATVRGTVWTTTDRCDGTLTTVKRGKVAVRDFRRKKTILLTAGKRYLARAPG